MTIDKLGEEIYVLEDENEKMKEEVERVRDEEGGERERLDALCGALKEVRYLFESTPTPPFHGVCKGPNADYLRRLVLFFFFRN